MTTAEALCEAARSIFSLNVQFPRCSKAIHCLVFGGTWKRVRGSQPRRSATEMGNTFRLMPICPNWQTRKKNELQVFLHYFTVMHYKATILLLRKPKDNCCILVKKACKEPRRADGELRLPA